MFDKPWVFHLTETCCCSTNLCTWRPNIVYKNRRVHGHHSPSTFMHRLRECGDPGLPLRDSRYAYKSRSHDQYVVSPHKRAHIKVTSSIIVPNIIVLQVVTWPQLILPRRATLELSSGYQAALMTHVMPTTLQTTDWETFLVRTSVIVSITIFIKVILHVWPS
jgi:hypothetical protein